MNDPSKHTKPKFSDFPPVFLVGMMGSGKSYCCKQLVKHLNFNGIDLDALIEERHHQSIANIFEQSGEAYFRKEEAAVLREIGIQKHTIIATGGGTPCFHQNMQWMNEHGITVWLNTPVNVLVQRLWHEKKHRPLIAHFENVNDLEVFLNKKLEERNEFYALAHIHMNEVNLNIHSLLNEIEQLFKNNFQHNYL
ncbi:shikimate kinase [Hydrotalea sandarakina]|jgi:shikimate kinase|uniref:Shikimate kinase n=1 Tax=Hydrotalea sandarakina TaxID=1004304 RepID=A0A2W7TET6_9BACT|nr:shikimate kinase [Hydrotalea sandarakina]PZX61832.1 shikimate kinase [Hydrotalea sandarakina]